MISVWSRRTGLIYYNPLKPQQPLNRFYKSYSRMTTEASDNPLFGLWRPHHLKFFYYGPDCVQKHLHETLPSDSSKVFIITGQSLASKTPLIQQVEELLGSAHAGTFSGIKQHAPVEQLDQAAEMILDDASIDTVISVGGGSPIDSAKALSFRVFERSGKFLTHVTIPTTLSAAECTALAGYTQKDGTKTSAGGARYELAVSAIFYDPTFAKYTPTRLWVATGIRALDHAVESMYHPYATELPQKAMATWAAGTLFEYLPKAKATHPEDQEVITRLMLAAFASLGFLGRNFKGGLGLSHSLGYALGSPYGIPHGETSCMTLGHVVKLKAQSKKEDAVQLARLLPVFGGQRSGDDVKDAMRVGDSILDLVSRIGLQETLTQKGVDQDQVQIITQRATGGAKEGPLFDAVENLVKGLY